MLFGGGLVIGGPLREGKTVMRAGIKLDLAIAALKCALHLRDHFRRRPHIRLGAGEIELSR